MFSYDRYDYEEYLTALVEDTTPQLGGDLDGQSLYDLTNMVNGTFSGTGTFGDLIVDTDLIYTDSTNNYVGINTSSPLRTFHILKGTALSDFPANLSASTVAVLESDGANVLALVAGSGQDCAIQFYQDTHDDFVGAIAFGTTLRINVAGAKQFELSTTEANFQDNNITTSGSIISTGGNQTGKFLTGSAGNTVFSFSGANFDIRAGDGQQSSQNVLRVTQAGDFDFKAGNLITTGEINFRDTDISIGSTLTDGILDISADVEVDFFYDNAAVGDGVDGQSLNINRRTVQGSDYISLYVDKDRKGLIGFSGADDLLQLTANALTVNGNIVTTGTLAVHDTIITGDGTNAAIRIYEGADNKGLIVYGFDNVDDDYYEMRIGADGGTAIIASKSVLYKSYGTNAFNIGSTIDFYKAQRMLDDVVTVYGSGFDYAIGYKSSTDMLQIVDGQALGSNVRLEMDSSGNFDFQAGNIDTSGILDAGSYKVGGVAGASFDGAVTNITVVNGIITAAS